MGAPAREGYVALAVGLNGDSLATWFLGAVEPFLRERRVLVDLRVDDQEKTHLMLRNGEVAGCVSARKVPLQGCRLFALGRMEYRLTAAPGFAREHFPQGLCRESAAAAPLVVYNRKDTLHLQLLEAALGPVPEGALHPLPAHLQGLCGVHRPGSGLRRAARPAERSPPGPGRADRPGPGVQRPGGSLLALLGVGLGASGQPHPGSCPGRGPGSRAHPGLSPAGPRIGPPPERPGPGSPIAIPPVLFYKPGILEI